MRASVSIYYRTARDLGEWHGEAEGCNLDTIRDDCIKRLRRRRRGIKRIDRTKVKMLPALPRYWHLTDSSGNAITQDPVEAATPEAAALEFLSMQDHGVEEADAEGIMFKDKEEAA